MKKLFLTLAVIAMFINTKAQKNVVLRINHFLGATPFAFNLKATNNLNNEFNATRLEYYISNIIINHDSGQHTAIPNLYVLVDAGSNTDIDLGNFNITAIEGITFSIGVDSPNNNADPSLWPANHALSPKSPSMHWGWQSGYRFVAMEGVAGVGMISTYEIHALGNMNYFTTTVTKTAIEYKGKWVIAIDADYTKAIKDIDVTQNLISHGEADEAQKLLFNFRDNVFKPGTILTGIKEANNSIDVSVWPNPSNGSFMVKVPSINAFNKIIITDITGKVILTKTDINSSSTQTISIKNNGIYFMQVYNDDYMLGVKKLVVN